MNTPRFRGWKGGLALALPLLAVLSLLVAANIWAYQNLGRLDLTSGRVYSIGPETLKVLEGVDEPVDITWFYDVRNKSMVDALGLLRQYQAANDNIRVQGVDPTLQPAEARRLGVQFAGSAVLQSSGRSLTINGGTETDFTNGLIRILNQTNQTVCFTEGHLEANPFSLKQLDDLEDHGEDENLVARTEVHERHGMSMVNDALQTLGYTVRTVLPSQGDTPFRGCDLVVVAGPRRAFASNETRHLTRYLAEGGRAVLMLEPNVQHGLQPVLDTFGIVHHGQAVIDPSRHYQNDRGSPAVSDFPRHAIMRNLPAVFFPGTSWFTPAPQGLAEAVSVSPLVLSSDSTHPDGQPDLREARTLMLLATRRIGDTPVSGGGEGASLLLVGDADFATNRHYPVLGNGVLFVNAVNYLLQQEKLIDIRPRHYQSDSVQLTNTQMRFSFFLASVLMPLLAIMFGVFLWWRRR
ncbi:MAG: GldG family protein [Alcaligenaceae bacterium]|nr:GldG family protein [Alcaligenaceae bacterium]